MVGDINGDGVIDILDATLLGKYLSNPEKNLSADQLKAADINQDGKITLEDLTLLKKMIQIF